MNKSELVTAIAEEAGISKKAAEAAVNAFTSTVIRTVADGGKVQLIGFGTFEMNQRSARQGRNPQTGGIVEIPATNVPKFKAGRVFKDAVK